jgi:hypothetical protein
MSADCSNPEYQSGVSITTATAIPRCTVKVWISLSVGDRGETSWSIRMGCCTGRASNATLGLLSRAEHLGKLLDTAVATHARGHCENDAAARRLLSRAARERLPCMLSSRVADNAGRTHSPPERWCHEIQKFVAVSWRAARKIFTIRLRIRGCRQTQHYRPVAGLSSGATRRGASCRRAHRAPAWDGGRAAGADPPRAASPSRRVNGVLPQPGAP